MNTHLTVSVQETEATKLTSSEASLKEPEVTKKHSPSDNNDTTDVSANNPSCDVTDNRLPKLALPTFNGNPLDWQTF